MPKSWVEKHSLKKGDVIGIDEGTDRLVFYAGEKEAEKEEKSISINVDGKSLAIIKAEIVTAYLNNYHTIEIFSSTLHDDAPVIKGILRNLSGMEIIEQTGSRIVAKDLIDISSISIQSIIRRMDTITRSMIYDNLMCMQEKCDPRSILHRDVDVNRLYYLGFRVIKNAMHNPMLTSKLKTNPWKLHSDKMIMIRVEEIADRQKRVCRLFAEAGFKGKMLEEFQKMNEEIKERYDNAMKAYYTNDKKIAYEIETTNNGFIERCDRLLEDISKEVCLFCQSGFVELSPQKSSAKKMEGLGHNLSGNKNVSISKLFEHIKATITFIRYIARTVLNID
ncbi:hypothetical protein HYU50_04000 [Candidatus Woesearchaeota archaeon]|nr:hypothetical protein [Candidatus Woesearchaeota archaeon]